MPKLQNTPNRTLKPAAWGVCGAVSAGLVSLLVIGEPRLALAIGALNGLVSTVLFYCLERRPAGRRSISLTPSVIWFTGLPSSGKTTLALALKDWLESGGVQVEHLDGDAVRNVVSGIGFSRSERNDHIRRMGFLASRFEQQGITVIASFVSPYRESRDFARRICKNFIEVYLSTELEECARRDVKGLYREAREGKRSGLTGVDDPYEPPSAAEIVLDTSKTSIEQCLAAIKSSLIERGLLFGDGARPKQNIGEYGSSVAARAR